MWDDIVAWFQSPGGARVLQTAIIPAVAILVAGVLAAVIARSAVRATLRRAERVEAASVVAVLVAAARATADASDEAARRRALRLRSEADVRVRLLPLPGASLAADWASARIDALQPGSGASAAFTELRDALVAWVSRPTKARRLFASSSAAGPKRTSPAPEQPTTAAPAAPEPAPATAGAAPTASQPRPETVAADAPGVATAAPEADQARFARPEPQRIEAEAAPAPEPAPEPALAEAPAAASADALPAWQRTRAMERLQQERRTRGVEAPTSDIGGDPGTAPVLLQHTHRATEPEPSEVEAVRLEAHQQARHARPEEQPVAGAAPAPAWLDQYDDEAHVTQNLDLKTPPPVAASAVRDRGQGEDLVPRS